MSFFRAFLFVFQEEDNEYRLDGFVVGDDDDSGTDTGKRRRHKSSDSNKRKRLRKAREDHGMEAADDEDLELIREAQGVMYVPYRILSYRTVYYRIVSYRIVWIKNRRCMP